VSSVSAVNPSSQRSRFLHHRYNSAQGEEKWTTAEQLRVSSFRLTHGGWARAAHGWSGESSSGRTSNSPRNVYSCKSPTRERWTFRRWPRSVSESAVFEEFGHMKPDDKTERIKPVRGSRGRTRDIERERESEARKYRSHSLRDGLRNCGKSCAGSAQGEARTNIKRQQLREDRTKSFLYLRGSRLCWRLRSLLCSLRPARAEGHRQNQPAQPRPRIGEREYGCSHSVTPLSMPTRGIRMITPGTQCAGYSQYPKHGC